MAKPREFSPIERHIVHCVFGKYGLRNEQNLIKQIQALFDSQDNGWQKMRNKFSNTPSELLKSFVQNGVVEKRVFALPYYIRLCPPPKT